MTIAYHSQNRKELVKAISEIIGIPAVYQFMPTCAYQIGECYTVTKSGDLEISDGFLPNWQIGAMLFQTHQNRNLKA